MNKETVKKSAILVITYTQTETISLPVLNQSTFQSITFFDLTI